MPYSEEINRVNPTAFLFAIDRSGSMSELMPHGQSKAQCVSDVMNRIFTELILKCTGSEGIRQYFDLGVIGYDTTLGVANPLTGDLAKEWVNSISLFATNPLRVEVRPKKIPDGAGGVIETNVKFQVWFDPIAKGGTPMCAALQTAYDILNHWCATHPNAYPPLFIHITDGQSTDGDPEELAKKIQQLSTNDGNVLVFNIHLSSQGSETAMLPSSVYGLPDNYAEKLFRMSSYMPEKMVAFARQAGIKNVSSESRCFAYNVQEITQLVELLDIGTRAATDAVGMDR